MLNRYENIKNIPALTLSLWHPAKRFSLCICRDFFTMSKICGIYKITSPSDGVYVGQSVDIRARFRKYKAIDCKSQSRLYRSLLKHGYNDHIFEIIEVCERSMLNEREIFYIKELNTFNSKNGMNLRSGSQKGEMSEETKRLISLNSKSKARNFKHSEETKQLLRELRLKQKCPSTGKRSPEICAKFKISNKGRVTSDETKKKISESLRNSEKYKKRSRESIEKRIISFKLTWERKRNGNQ